MAWDSGVGLVTPTTSQRPPAGRVGSSTHRHVTDGQLEEPPVQHHDGPARDAEDECNDVFHERHWGRASSGRWSLGITSLTVSVKGMHRGIRAITQPSATAMILASPLLQWNCTPRRTQSSSALVCSITIRSSRPSPAHSYRLARRGESGSVEWYSPCSAWRACSHTPPPPSRGSGVG